MNRFDTIEDQADLPALDLPRIPSTPCVAGCAAWNVASSMRFSPVLSCLILLILLSQVVACFVGSKPSLNGQIDFRAFYTAGLIVRNGNAAKLYDYEYVRNVQNAVVSYRASALPFLYPPFAALAFVPFSSLSYRVAFFVMAFLGVCLLFVAADILRRAEPRLAAFSPAVLGALYGCFFGVAAAIMQGQVSCLLLVIYSGSYLLHRQRHPRAAGLLLALALIKFQIVLPILALCACWRMWRFLSGFAMGATGLLGLSTIMVGSPGLRAYLQFMVHAASTTAADATAAKAQYGMYPTDMPNLHGLSYAIAHGATWGHGLDLLLCCVVFGYVARQAPSLPLALPAAMLMSYHMQPHDLTLLLLPLTMLLTRFASVTDTGRFSPARRNRRFYLWFAPLLLLLIFPFAALLSIHRMNYLGALAVGFVMYATAQAASAETKDSSNCGPLFGTCA